MRSFRSTLNVALLGTTLLTTAALAQGTPDRKAFFGETHVHTSWSFDIKITSACWGSSALQRWLLPMR